MARIKIDDLKQSKVTEEQMERVTGGAFGDGSVRFLSDNVTQADPIPYLKYKLGR